MAMMSDWDADGKYEASCHEHGHLSWHTNSGDAASAELDHQIDQHKAELPKELNLTIGGSADMRRKLERYQKRNKFPKPGKKKNGK